MINRRMHLYELLHPSTNSLLESFKQNSEGFDPTDLLSVMRAFIAEGKNDKPRPVHSKSLEPAPEVVFKKTQSYADSIADKIAATPGLQAKIDAFIAAKTADKMQAVGGSDTPFISAGPIGRAMPGLRHAHLTRDLSMVYTISGSKPSVITLYGVFRHAETGTGTPANVNKQKSFGKYLSNQ